MANPELSTVAKKLKKFDPSKSKVLVGLDGFVDLIIDVVDKRTGPEDYTRVETIAAQSAALVAQLRQMAREGSYGSDN